jgi:hypothetical protein
LQAANTYTDSKVSDAAGAALEQAQDYDDAGDAATLASANGYTDTRETTVRADMVTGDAATLQAANTYTDRRFDAWDAQFDNFSHEIDNRLHRQDRRIDRVGAMGAAMLNMAINAAGGQSERGRIAVGAGFQGGEQSLSVGYGKRIGRASFSLGGAFSGSERSAGVGFGVDL